jgi:hypothetical protein
MKTLIGVLLVTELAAFGPSGLGQSVANDPEVLREKAIALYDVPARYPEAAELHVREAQLRGGGPKAADALVRAARLRQYHGKTGEALRLMKWAATVALDCGDVVQAAHAYLDAAFLAMHAKRVDEGYALARRAQRLADSPLLDASAREAILRRITRRATAAS